jgi:hypothetical protein
MMRIILLVIAAVGILWSLTAWLVGGFGISLGALRVSTADPFRPLILAAVFFVAYCLASGKRQLRLDLAHVPKLAVPTAMLLALSPMVAGIAHNSWTAGGSDSYAYVAQADLWLQGTQTVSIPIAQDVPWPEAIWSFTPHGFRAAPSGDAIVPVTAPGLSLMMAAAKAVAGHSGMFYVVPATGALLVFVTFLIGRRMRSDTVGIGSAWLMATSPVFLAMLVSPMSDVPAAAFWALAIYFALGPTNRSALLAGFCSSAAIVIRPNLAPLAGVLFAAQLFRGAAEHRPWKRAAYFAAAASVGCASIAAVNRSLYGSPLSSGYGDLSYLFSPAYIPTNVQRYGIWFIESQTPIALLGLAALAFESWMLLTFVVTVFALYIAYTPFDAWWFLRFLLPAWPAVCVGTSALLLRRVPGGGVFLSIAAAVLVAIGVHGIWFAATHGAFPSGEGDHRYATIGKLVEQATDPSSVILTGQNSGATRYYGGRLTMRFDLLDEAWLDSAVTWLTDRGRHPYFLLEEWELPRFQRRFAPRNKLGALALTPVMAYDHVYLFDPSRPDGPMLRPTPPPSAWPKCVEPAEPLMLNLR